MALGKRQQAIIKSLQDGSVDSIRCESLTGKYVQIINGEYGEYVSTPTMDSLVWNHRNLFTSIERVYRSGLSIPETEYSL
tara:strand:+ start:272 stop:511 length:240 start_codon:yes stop_codon:yes gene_type:complete